MKEWRKMEQESKREWKEVGVWDRRPKRRSCSQTAAGECCLLGTQGGLIDERFWRLVWQSASGRYDAQQTGPSSTWPLLNRCRWVLWDPTVVTNCRKAGFKNFGGSKVTGRPGRGKKDLEEQAVDVKASEMKGGERRESCMTG